MYRRQKKRHCSYLQWYPFAKLSKADWDYIESPLFYARYISDAAFILMPECSRTAKCFMQKANADLRVFYLLHPIMFLYIQACGLAVFRRKSLDLQDYRSAHYSGSYENGSAHYKGGYDEYCIEAKKCSERYTYCLKTDISNFFSNINIEQLIDLVDKATGGTIGSVDLAMLSGLLSYCGRGQFPIIQNSVASSFLATQILLDQVDRDFANALLKNKFVTEFRFVRYVDDLHIFFNIDETRADKRIAKWIIKTYARALEPFGLSLNYEKTHLVSKEELPNSLAGASFEEEEQTPRAFSIEPCRIAGFYEAIAKKQHGGNFSAPMYQELLLEFFGDIDTCLDAREVYRDCYYHRSDLFKEGTVIAELTQILDSGAEVLLYDCEGTMKAILNTHDEYLNKGVLNKLFTTSRSKQWTAYETMLATTYLRYRGMRHPDLLSTLNSEQPDLGSYVADYCCGRFLDTLEDNATSRLLGLLEGDRPSRFQYLMYLKLSSIGNHFEAATYYRSYFDRVATLASRALRKKQGKKVRRGKWLYGKDCSSFFSSIEGAEQIVESNERIRRQNPLVHAESTLLDGSAPFDVVKESTFALQKLLNDCIENDPLGIWDE